MKPEQDQELDEELDTDRPGRRRDGAEKGDRQQDGDEPDEDGPGEDEPDDGGESGDGVDEPDPDDVAAMPPSPGILIDQPEGAAGAVTVHEALPETMFVFPLRRAVPFPHLMMPLLLDTPEARDIVAKAEAHNGHLFVVAMKDPQQDKAEEADLHEIGVAGRILKVLKLPDGNMSAMTQGLRRARVVRMVRKRPYMVARIKEVVEIPATGKRAESLTRLLRENLQRIAQNYENLDASFVTTVLNLEQPEALADFTGGVLRRLEDRQRILETADVEKRLELALEFIMGELELAELDNKIQDEIRSRAEKAQKEYFLREQLKIIRRELGEEKDPRLQEMQRLEQAIEESGMPEEARTRADEEMNRLRTTPVESPEYGVIRNYLDWLTSLPWSRSSDDNTDLSDARRVLDDDHYGLDEVKERILEFLAVRKLRPGHSGSILCFAGPPGVGKTSLGRSIATAMNRKFWRFSLGGMRDEAEIKGHRRTYIGAMPGRILQGLKACGTNNPVIMLDEVDKLGADFRGDPSSALLEVLDPEQNQAFLDHYLDVSFDLSRVMFLATANVLPQVPDPLRDRMEVIELPGYLLDEKVQIARRHLLPRLLERHGLKKSHLSLTVSVLKRIVPLYTREAGVRGLEKTLARLCRKAAHAVARNAKPPNRVKLDDVEELLGAPRFRRDELRKQRVAGVVQGLAWTPVGGDILYIEAVDFPGKGALTLTGSLGDVMSESARMTLSYLKSRAASFGLDAERIANTDMHLHFPAGAIPKDGPSAGIAIACAFASYLLDRPTPTDIAMTGELTAVGEVLPVGGVREKVLAAQNLGIKSVILPAGNEVDVDELKPELVKGLKFHYVVRFDEVFDVVFRRGNGRKTGGRKRKMTGRRGSGSRTS